VLWRHAAFSFTQELTLQIQIGFKKLRLLICEANNTTNTEESAKTRKDKERKLPRRRRNRKDTADVAVQRSGAIKQSTAK
jgi:hypothetical protein